MTSNSRKPTLSKAPTMDLRMPARSDKAMCVIAIFIAVLLVVAGCSPSLNGSRHLAEYISGSAYYGEVYSSDADAPKRVTIESVFALPYPGIDSRVSRGTEEYDEYVLELRHSSGRVLRSINFNAVKNTSIADPGGPATYAEFEVVVENPPNYASLAVLHDGNQMAVVERSANAPSVSVSGPAEGRVFYDGDSVPLGLKASDADGDVLDYRVYFSTDGGDSYEVLLEKYALRIPAVSLDSSTQARLAVSVSDGARSSFTETEIFTVAKNVPAETTVNPANLPPKAYDDTVGRVNQPPVANDDIVGGDIGEVLRIDVLANDIDAEKDFDNESLVIDVPPTFGTASVKVKREFIAEGNSEDLIEHSSGGAQAVSSLTLRPLTLKQADIGSLQNIDTPPTLPSILKYFIEYHYAFTAIDSLTYSICDTFDQCDTAEVTIKAGTADCTIVGTEDDDTLRGTSGNDVICGLAGDDTIHAGGGDDIIKAGLGDDVVFAETGDDTIYGEAGDDTIDSGTGDDIVRGSDGDDRITGGNGADELYGGLGNDVLDGGTGNDIIHGSKGDDTIYGGPGDDTIRGNLGADIIYPGEGDDTLEGSTEQDTIIQ